MGIMSSSGSFELNTLFDSSPSHSFEICIHKIYVDMVKTALKSC
jgi:hypothetical protein